MRPLLQCIRLSVLVLFASDMAYATELGLPNKTAEFRIDTYGGMPQVRVTFDGVEYLFAADTGSVVTSFEPEMLPLLVRSDRGATLLDAHAAVNLPMYRSPEGRIGNTPLRSLASVFCFEHRMNRIRLRKHNGDLGMDALRDYVMSVDFDAGVVAILREVPRDAGRRLELDLRTGRPIVTARLGDVPLTFMLNTGSNCYGAGDIRKREFDELVDRGKLTIVDEIPIATDFGVSKRRAAVARVPLTIGGFEHGALVLRDFEAKDERREPNSLGVGFLRRFVVTFDFPHSAVYLSPGAQFRKIDASHDPGGVRLKREGQSVLVTHIPSASVMSVPALQAGVNVGDRLETVNNVATSRLNDVDLTRLLSDTTRPTSLTFRRASDDQLIYLDYDEREIRRRSLERYNTPLAGDGVRDSQPGERKKM